MAVPTMSQTETPRPEVTPLRRLAAAAALCLLLAACGGEPDPASDYDPAHDYFSFANANAFVTDHLSLDLTVDFDKRRLEGTATLQSGGMDGLQVMTAGPASANPVALLSSKRLADFLHRLDLFDWHDLASSSCARDRFLGGRHFHTSGFSCDGRGHSSFLLRHCTRLLICRSGLPWYGRPG